MIKLTFGGMKQYFAKHIVVIPIVVMAIGVLGITISVTAVLLDRNKANVTSNLVESQSYKNESVVSDNNFCSPDDGNSENKPFEMIPSMLNNNSNSSNPRSSSFGSSNTLSISTSSEDSDIKTPTLISTKYPTEDIVIADFIVTNSAFNADPTGKLDSSNAIQNAINLCHSSGGGTVWMPAGKYLVNYPIVIKPFVTLRGDWQDPDIGSDYGTIILAGVISLTTDTPGLFTIGGSGGVKGLTVYYTDQDIDNVKPYPYTFYVPGDTGGLGYYMLQSITNCTVINGYKGIGACISSGVHEMMTVDNVKGTFIYRGATAYNQADVGTWKNLKLSNTYWANAGNGLVKAERSKIDAYTQSNGIGMVLGDLEWTQFANISISDYKIGINIVKGKRIEFAGSMYGLYIQRCSIGLKVDSIDERWGMVIANSSIEGNSHSIVNITKGTVKTAATTLVGNTSGSNVIQDTTAMANFSVDYTKAQPRPPARLFDAVKTYGADNKGKTSAVTAVQKALDSAGSAGGGVVYLSPGKYKVDKGLTVPANVELRGASSVATRDQGGLSLGTVILAYYGENSINPDDSTALITLHGENSGVNGFNIVYPENPPVNKTVKKYAYAIRGKTKGVYAVNMSVSAAYNGIDFRNCSNHFIKKFISCCYNNAINIGNSTGGRIEGCLQNGTVITRNGLNLNNWVPEDNIFTHLFDPITRLGSTFINMNNADQEEIFNVFAYGVKILIDNKSSTNVLAFNIGADNIGSLSPLINTDGGSMTIVNMMRYNGKSFTNNGTNLKIYNRLSIMVKNEGNIP